MPDSRFVDPRTLPDFRPELLPLCDGEPPPDTGTTDRIDCRILEFVAAYYRLNESYSRLLEVRESGGAIEEEQDALRSIQTAMQDRDALEDRYAPEGFLGDPVMEGVFYRNLIFAYSGKRLYRELESSSSFSLFVPMPPPGVDLDAWVRQHVDGLFPDAVNAGPDEKSR